MFISPQLKAKAFLKDCRPFVRQSVHICKLFLSRTTKPVSTKLSTNRSWTKWIQFVRVHAFFNGDNK